MAIFPNPVDAMMIALTSLLSRDSGCAAQWPYKAMSVILVSAQLTPLLVSQLMVVVHNVIILCVKKKFKIVSTKRLNANGVEQGTDVYKINIYFTPVPSLS